MRLIDALLEGIVFGARHTSWPEGIRLEIKDGISEDITKSVHSDCSKYAELPNLVLIDEEEITEIENPLIKISELESELWEVA